MCVQKLLCAFFLIDEKPEHPSYCVNDRKLFYRFLFHLLTTIKIVQFFIKKKKNAVGDGSKECYVYNKLHKVRNFEVHNGFCPSRSTFSKQLN